MGLDMYLEKRTYVKNGDHMEPEERITITVTRNGKPLPGIDTSRIQYIVEEAGYWRKANAIHRWFVDHVQGGNDDWGYYYVSEDQLQELLEIVDIVLAASELAPGTVEVGYRYSRGPDGELHKIPSLEDGEVIRDPTVAHKLLPTTSGFFFGSTAYDEYYVEDLQKTKRILESALADESGDYYYRSSW